MRFDVFLHREGELQYWVGHLTSDMGWVELLQNLRDVMRHLMHLSQEFHITEYILFRTPGCNRPSSKLGRFSSLASRLMSEMRVVTFI